MKYSLLFTLLMCMPMVGMDKNYTNNACMMYASEPSMRNSHTLLQSGLMASSLVMYHAKKSPTFNATIKKARQGAFIVPALIAYNSDAIKNSIMDQLPPLNPYVDVCVDKGIKNTLLYGGIALAGYLFYTETLEYLTKRDLTKIFEPLKLKSQQVRIMAGKDHDDTQVIDMQLTALSVQAKKVVKQLADWEQSTKQKEESIALRTKQLQLIQQGNAQAIGELKALIEQINIPALTEAVKEIEKNCKTQKDAIQKEFARTREIIEFNGKHRAAQIAQATQTHTSRAHVTKMLSQELSSDVDALFEQVIVVANQVYNTRSRLDYVCELAGKLENR